MLDFFKTIVIMLLFHTRDKTKNSTGIVFKDIIVTFTVVPALHRVVYLLWPSTFKGNVTRDSKNVCHGMYMVNSKSIMFSTCCLTHKFSSFDNSLCLYNGDSGRRISPKIRWLQMVGAVVFACLKHYNFVCFNKSIEI